MKDMVDSKALDISVQAFDQDDHWFLTLSDGSFNIFTVLSKTAPGDASDVTDFVTNFLPSANARIDTQYVRGASDDTLIGNVGDSLKVTHTDTPGGGSGGPPAYSKKLRYRDMNAGTGGVARDTAIGSTFTDIFSRSGSGLVIGFLATLEKLGGPDEWFIRLVIDSEDIFGASGISTEDMRKKMIYGYFKGASAHDDHGFMGLNIEDKDTFRWNGPLDYPITYLTSFVVKVKIASGTGKFLAGLASLTEET